MRYLKIFNKKAWLILCLFCMKGSQIKRYACCFLLTTFSTLFSVESYANKEIDSLRNCANTTQVDSVKIDCQRVLAIKFLQLNFDSALFYGKKTVQLAKEQHDKAEVAKALGVVAYAFSNLGSQDSALTSYKKSAALFKELQMEHELAMQYFGISQVYLEMGDYVSAIDWAFQSIEIREKLEYIPGLVIGYNGVGKIYQTQERYDQALEFYQKALRYAEQIGRPGPIGACMGNVAQIQGYLGQNDEALETLFKAMEIFKKTQNPVYIANGYSSIAIVYENKGEFENAIKYQHLALAMNKKLGYSEGIANSYISLGTSYSKLYELENALAYFDSALTLAIDHSHIERQIDCYKNLAQIAVHSGNGAKAYEYQLKYSELRDSLLTQKNMEAIAEMKEKYEAEQKDRKLAEKELQRKEALAEAQRSRLLAIGAGGGVLAIVFIVLLYLGKRKAREKQKQAELEQKALRAQMNPHFLFNSLNAVQQMYMSGETDLANNYMGDFGQLLRQVLDNSGKEKITVKEEVQMLELYLELEKGQGDEPFDYTIKVDERIDQLHTLIPPMVIQPIVENAVWHGVLPKKGKGTVSVALKMLNDELMEVIVEDDGVGMSETKDVRQKTKEKGHVSKGMKLVEERLGTKMKVEKLAPGTRVTIYVPIG